MTRSAASLLTGRRTKFLVLVFWLVLVGIAGPLAGKLTGAQENDTAAWLPGSAESTKVLEIQQSFQSPDALPAVVVYDRPGGLTAADRAKAAADARAVRHLRGRAGQARRADPVPGRAGAADGRDVRPRSERLGEGARPRRADPGRSPAARRT